MKEWEFVATQYLEAGFEMAWYPAPAEAVYFDQMLVIFTPQYHIRNVLCVNTSTGKVIYKF